MERWQATMLGFLSAELRAGWIFIELASKPVNSSLNAKYIGQAQEACDTIERFSRRVELMGSERERIQDDLVSLKLRLADLGEGFDGLNQLQNDVERFLLSCVQLRANATRMRIQNHKLVEQNRHAFSET